MRHWGLSVYSTYNMWCNTITTYLVTISTTNGSLNFALPLDKDIDFSMFLRWWIVFETWFWQKSKSNKKFPIYFPSLQSTLTGADNVSWLFAGWLCLRLFCNWISTELVGLTSKFGLVRFNIDSLTYLKIYNYSTSVLGYGKMN